MKVTLLLLSFFGSGTLSLFADMLPYSSSGGSSLGTGIFYQYSINDSVGSSNLKSVGVASGTTSAQVPFTFTLALPSLTDYEMNSASLSFSGNTTDGAAFGYSSYGSQGYYVNGTYPVYCQGSFGYTYFCGTQNTYSNSYAPAQASFYGGSYAELTGISDGSQSANVSVGSGGTMDLLALGFGNDLLAGGTLTLSGYREVYSGLNSISYNGFNAYTNFNVNVNGSGDQSATLSLGGAPIISNPGAVPEPNSGVLFLGGVGIATLYWFRAKRINCSTGL